MPRAPLLFTTVLPFAALAWAGCEANLEETCRDGDCTTATVSTGSGEGGGGETCTDAGGLPCDVFAVLSANCHVCHGQPQQNGAPFSLLTYDDTQADYFGAPRWTYMKTAVEAGFMPFGADDLVGPPLETLQAWWATCEAGECARGPGGGTGGAGGAGGAGQGGAGGAGGATSSSTGGGGGAGGAG